MAIGIRDLGFHQEVQDFLGRQPRLEIVGAAVDADRLVGIMSDRTPDVALACPILGRELRHPAVQGGPVPLVVVAQEMTVPILREAIEAHARAVFSWPEERDELARTLAGMRSTPGIADLRRGRVTAVHGARGGAGASFLATHLAFAFASRGLKTVLVDLDVAFADISAALGITPDSATRTVRDLVPVIEELSPEHLGDALYAHPRGFDVLLAPAEARDARAIPHGLYRGAVALLAGSHQAVVLHVPRVVSRAGRMGLRLADRVVLVTTRDLFSLYGARRTKELLGPDVGEDAWSVVVNRPARSALSDMDVERVLGSRPVATIRSDARVRRVQERGELLPDRGGAMRDVRRLAGRLLSGIEPAERAREEA